MGSLRVPTTLDLRTALLLKTYRVWLRLLSDSNAILSAFPAITFKVSVSYSMNAFV
jgi:hypothetical protein